MSCNKIRDQIHIALEFTKRSKIPVLFFSNPGMAKTTIIETWAEYNKYEYEELIGSRFCKEEIAGYQAKTNDDLLRHLSPDWFDRIWERNQKNIPTLLFLDEISTCSEDVQGSLLQLIFARTIACGKKLPDDCLVVAAANYKENLPMQFDIMPPTLNRFCVVNLQIKRVENFIEEFMQDPDDRFENLIEFKNNQIAKEEIDRNIEGMFKRIFDNFSKNAGKPKDKGVQGILSINNQKLNGLYADACSLFEDAPVYNFISGRTIYYTKIMAQTISEMGISSKYRDMISNMLYGLIGAGTLSFTSKKEYESFQKILREGFFLSISKNKEEQVELNIPIDTDKEPVAVILQKYLSRMKKNGSLFDFTLFNVYLRIREEYSVESPGKMEERLKKEDFFQMHNDLEQINDFSVFLKNSYTNTPESILNGIEKIAMAWDSYRMMMRSI